MVLFLLMHVENMAVLRFPVVAYNGGGLVVESDRVSVDLYAEL